jgi:DNA-directed RNA polymerase subunit RPC12/RpoP
MNVVYACPRCGATNRQQVVLVDPLKCVACGQTIAQPEGAVTDGQVHRCLACPSVDLFLRKDFPQRTGVALVAIAVVGSSAAWYYGSLTWTFGILFATALVDLILYLIVGNSLMCYRCGAQYRGVANLDSYGAFDLETHEKHRQIVARQPKAPAASQVTPVR